MATISPSPSPAPRFTSSKMATRRAPLASNPNAANSPIRPAQSLATKYGRTYSKAGDRDPQQQPPAKKQALNNGGQRYLTYRGTHLPAGNASHTSTYDAKISRERSRPQQDKGSNTSASSRQKLTNNELDNLRQWQNHHRAKFPKFVFYFAEKMADRDRHRCAKQLPLLGSCHERFFSNAITHVVTTRTIPPPVEKVKVDVTANEQDQPQTINPAILSRDPAQASRRTIDASSLRRVHNATAVQEEKKPKPKNTDVLYRARDMGMKIWSLDKFQRVLDLLLEDEGARGRQGNRQADGEPNLLQMLQNERVNGPADRDPTVAAKELHIFKGPYIYIYDTFEKLKPILVREYTKVANKQDGDWPQFRSVAGGRCPFVEEPEAAREAIAAQKERARKAAKTQDARSTIRTGLGKRSLSQMQDGQNRGAPPRAIFEPPKPVISKDARENAFTSRAVAPRLLAGEPVASGLQKSKITSAIQSQMISSTTGALGAKAGTSKEVQGLQRAVLQRHTSILSQEAVSRPTPGTTTTQEDNTSSRPTSQGRSTRQRLDMIAEETARQIKAKKPKSRAQVAVKPKKRDPKPGYCENCQDKFDDFDEHIDSRKHRRFAENNTNWAGLDSLLSLLERPSKPNRASRCFDTSL